MRPPGRASVSDGLKAMPCLAAGIDGYSYSLNKRQAEFTLRRFALPSGTWVSIGDVANRVVKRLTSSLIDTSRLPFEDEVPQ
jgi:hypothetical protein